jgi:hypothetical protein
MNQFLYKYMPLRADFFTTPMIRATPAWALNDPFEGYFNGKQLGDVDSNHGEFFKKNGKDVYKIDDSEIRARMGDIQGEFSDLGIISFTEEPNNPLMWAHYANKYKGVVIEFDFSQPFFMDSVKEANGRKSRFGENNLGDIFEFPEKVDYRKDMPVFERPESSVPDNIDEFHWKKFNRTILFTKANEWIYEKEQRTIVRLHDADSIICNDDKYVRKICAKESAIKLVELEEKKIQIIYPNEYEMYERSGDESIKGEIHRLTENYEEPAIHLFRINPRAINAVYFGCRSKHEEALGNIRNNSSLLHLKYIYKMKINHERYHFDARELNI